MTKPRIVSYSIVHYGADYLSYALRSVINHVDQAIVIYTPHPSHGHSTTVQCPESESDILQAANIDSDKVRTYTLSGIRHEGPQRDYAVEMCRQAGADLILVVDCDEVWHSDVLTKALDYAWTENKARNWLINFTHLWRSFNWVCRDQGWPVRIIDLRHPMSTVAYIPKEFGDIYHFGYCIRNNIMDYKLRIHGHKYELRSGWFENRWLIWPPPDDCHPTNSEGFWNPQPFDKEQLPPLMREHPFWDLERVE